MCNKIHCLSTLIAGSCELFLHEKNTTTTTTTTTTAIIMNKNNLVLDLKMWNEVYDETSNHHKYSKNDKQIVCKMANWHQFHLRQHQIPATLIAFTFVESLSRDSQNYMRRQLAMLTRFSFPVNDDNSSAFFFF